MKNAEKTRALRSYKDMIKSNVSIEHENAASQSYKNDGQPCQTQNHHILNRPQEICIWERTAPKRAKLMEKNIIVILIQFLYGCKKTMMGTARAARRRSLLALPGESINLKRSNGLSSCQIPEEKLWKSRYNLDMLMMDG